MKNKLILMIFLSSISSLSGADNKIRNDIFGSGVTLSSYYAHFQKVLEFTKKGWAITNVDSIMYVETARGGGVFATYPETSYVLRNDKENSTIICSVFGKTAGGFDTTVTYSLQCFR